MRVMVGLFVSIAAPLLIMVTVASGQTTVQDLPAALGGTVVAPRFAVAYSADLRDRSYQNNLPGSTPVKTELSLDGRLIYRIEENILRVDAYSHRSFPAGTQFKITQVKLESKDIELLLTPLSQAAGFGDIKILFGKGYDSMPMDEILKQIHQMLPPGSVADSAAADNAKREATLREGSESLVPFAPFTPPPSAPGAVFTPAAQKKLRSLQSDLQLDTRYRSVDLYVIHSEEIANIYLTASDWLVALSYLDHAMPVAEMSHNQSLPGHIATNIGIVYVAIGDYQKALKYLTAAGDVCVRHQDLIGLSHVYTNMAVVNIDLGQYNQALEKLELALPLKQRTKDKVGEANVLTNEAGVYFRLKQYEKAIALSKQGLAIYQQIGEKDHQAASLGGIGLDYAYLGEFDNALTYLAQALVLTRTVADRGEEAGVLVMTALVYTKKGDNKNALLYLSQALPLVTSLGSDLSIAATLFQISVAYRDDQPALAIFYGKEAIDHLQKVRQKISGVRGANQSDFLSSTGIGGNSISDYYRSLADLLIAQHRLEEAQQILDLLKGQEYADYTRGLRVASTEVSAPEPVAAPALTPAERQAKEDYTQSSAQIFSIGEQWQALQKNPSRTKEEEKQYQQLSAQLTDANRQMDPFLKRTFNRFDKGAGANKEVAEISGNAALLKQQLAHMPHTVALYTVVTKDHYSVIVINGTTMIPHEMAISQADLNLKINAFLAALRNPSLDPKQPALDLYRILVAPIAADLAQVQATTILWMLDGRLRYLPMGALYDGRQYLIEKYESVNITPVSIPHLADKPDVHRLSIAAMGISNKYDTNLNALPSVVTELNGIVKDPAASSSHGVLPGSILLNAAFTEKSMEDHLDGNHPIVHIASHFVFRPGDDSQSYLLLADRERPQRGYHLSVADFRDNQKLSLDNVDLITLSACETGISGDDSDGREIDGLATTAQLKGARAVISSLWDVDDFSTGQLMADFYRRWASGNVTKAEALRHAQLDLLTDSAPAATHQSTPVAATKFSHPYYWAPFVLMGNWQ